MAEITTQLAEITENVAYIREMISFIIALAFLFFIYQQKKRNTLSTC